MQIGRIEQLSTASSLSHTFLFQKVAELVERVNRLTEDLEAIRKDIIKIKVRISNVTKTS